MFESVHEDKDINVLVEVYSVREFIKVVEEISGIKIDFEPTSFEDFAKTKDVKELHELWAKWVILNTQFALIILHGDS